MDEGAPAPRASSVDDFSEQWTEYTAQSGYYASEQMLRDYLGPLLDPEVLRGSDVAEVGSGNGRFVIHLAAYARSVTGIEPSDAVEISRRQTDGLDNVHHVHQDIYDVEMDRCFDFVFCLGVLHHTPDPVETVKRIHRMLRPYGRAVIWVYGREGNEVYLALAKALRVVTTRLSHRSLQFLSKILRFPLKAYIGLCRSLPLPMWRYMREVLAKFDDYQLELTIYDQLNPSIAAYWSRDQFRRVLEAGGFFENEFHHRHRYSWTAVSTKRDADGQFGGGQKPNAL